jgi:hypothetical protein
MQVTKIARMKHLSVAVDSHIDLGNKEHGGFSTGIGLFSSLLLMYHNLLLGGVVRGLSIDYEDVY